MRVFTKDSGFAKEWVWLTGSSSDSGGAARECITKGGEINSSSAVSMGPGRPRTISWTETPQKEQGVSNQAQILPACLWNSSQPRFSGCYQRWLRWEPRTNRDHSASKSNRTRHIRLGKQASMPDSFLFPETQINVPEFYRFSFLFQSWGESLWFFPLTLLGKQNYFYLFHLDADIKLTLHRVLFTKS